MDTRFPWEETLDAALGVEGKDEEEDDDEKSVAGSDASSEFGFGGGKKPVAKTKPSAEPAPKRANPAGPVTGTTKPDQCQNKAIEKGKAAMEQATKVMGTLAPLSSTAIWRGSFKDSDISARLKKASTTASSLSQQASTMEQSQTKAEMEGLAARMEQKVAEVSTLQEVLGQVHKSKQILSLVQDRHSADKLTSALPNMDAETVTNVLMTIGGKLSEACAGYLYFFAMQHRTNKVLQCHCAIVCVCVSDNHFGIL